MKDENRDHKLQPLNEALEDHSAEGIALLSAAAAIVCSAAGLKRIQASQARNVRVLATVMQSGSNRGITEFEKHASKLAAQKAYETKKAAWDAEVRQALSRLTKAG